MPKLKEESNKISNCEKNNLQHLLEVFCISYFDYAIKTSKKYNDVQVKKKSSSEPVS